MPQTQSRVVGSGFTTFNWGGKTIAFLDSVTDSGVTPVANAVTIHPLGDRYPREIATARAVDAGTLTVTIRELWNAPVWWQLGNLNGTWDIVNVWERLAADPGALTCQMVIKPPGSNAWRGKIYHNCVVTEIPDGETVTLQTMTVTKNVVVMYTHSSPLAQVV